jgi:uncharacterized membrane protein HdeD (DUF308 family)
MSKIKIFLTIFTFFLIYFLPFFALAQQLDPISRVLMNMINAVRILVALAFLIALFVFAWGIVRFIVAASDPDKIREARQFIFWGVIGMAVLASLFGLITFLQRYFGVSGREGTIPIPGVPGEAPTGQSSNPPTYCQLNPSDPACGL